MKYIIGLTKIILIFAFVNITIAQELKAGFHLSPLYTQMKSSESSSLPADSYKISDQVNYAYGGIVVAELGKVIDFRTGFNVVNQNFAIENSVARQQALNVIPKLRTVEVPLGIGLHGKLLYDLDFILYFGMSYAWEKYSDVTATGLIQGEELSVQSTAVPNQTYVLGLLFETSDINEVGITYHYDQKPGPTIKIGESATYLPAISYWQLNINFFLFNKGFSYNKLNRCYKPEKW